MKNIIIFGLLSIALLLDANAQGDGYIMKDGKRFFVMGSYYLPNEDAMFKDMVNAGFNLFQCSSKVDLDRVHKAGVQGWIPLPLGEGDSPRFKELVNAVAGHPALAVWEGPDELVWGFTAFSGLYRTQNIHKTPGEWNRLTPEALRYSREQSAIVMPNVAKAVAYVRSADPNNLQVWINEAPRSDIGYVWQFMDIIDITGCDHYPISNLIPEGRTKPRKEIKSTGKITERWTVASRGKPVWMVLQCYSSHELGVLDDEVYGKRPAAYPSFAESRYMAYDVIANGANGILYWNLRFLTSDPFRQSLYALTREFNALQPFLTTDPKPISITTHLPEQDANNRVAGTARQYGRDWMVALVNESDTTQHAAIVSGLDLLNGQQLVELYGEDEVTVKNGKIFVRLKPFEVKVYATRKKWETADKRGREYPGS
jgi:hypothetical protein